MTIDAIVYGYSLSKCEITPVQYGDFMAEEVIISAVLEMQAVAGFTAVAPIDSAKGLVIEKETIAKMELKDKATAFKDMAVSTLNEGYEPTCLAGSD